MRFVHQGNVYRVRVETVETFLQRVPKAGTRLGLRSLHYVNCISYSVLGIIIQRPLLGSTSNPPGCVLQSALDFAHLLFPKIHHRQMDPAVLMHADFPVHKHKHAKEAILRMKVCEENGIWGCAGRKRT